MIEVRIKIHALRNKEEILQLPYFADKSIYEYAEDILQIIVTTKIPDLSRILKQNTIRVLINNRVIDNNLLKTKKLKDNDKLTLVIMPAIETFAIMWAAIFSSIGWTSSIAAGASWVLGGLTALTLVGAVGLLQNALIPKPKKPSLNRNEMEDSQNYTWEGPTTSYAIGKPLSLIYGNPWVGGDIISAYIEGLKKSYGNSWWGLDKFEGHSSSYLTMGEMHGSPPTVGVPHADAAVLIDLSAEMPVTANEINFRFKSLKVSDF